MLVPDYNLEMETRENAESCPDKEIEEWSNQNQLIFFTSIVAFKQVYQPSAVYATNHKQHFLDGNRK